MSWHIVDFAFASLFSLRPSNTTSSGGKSLLIPTPFAIKMALLDRIIVNNGVDKVRSIFPAIRDLSIALRGPKVITVTNPIERIYRPRDSNWIKTVRHQEYCFYSEPLSIAFSSNDPQISRDLIFWVISLSYLGRKGGFIQFTNYAVKEILAPDFVRLCEPMAQDTLQPGILQYMDNMSGSCQFEDVSRFHFSKNNPRQHYHIVIPYRLKPDGYAKTIYERIHD